MHRRLLTLNGLAIVMVVLYHTVGWGFTAMFWWPHRYLPVTSPNFDQMYSASYFGLRFIEGAIAYAIPAFLLVSGFFVALSTKSEDSGPGWSQIRSRLRTLVIPYLIWSAIMIGVSVVGGEAITPLGVARALLIGGAAPAFYFVPLLVQLYLLGHFLIKWTRARPGLLLVIAAFVQILAHLGRYGQLLQGSHPILQGLEILSPAWFFPANVFWFVLGVVLGIRRTQLVPWLDSRRWMMLGLSIVLLVVGMLEWEFLLWQAPGPWLGPKETLVDNMYSLVAILAVLGFLGGFVPFASELQSIGAKSYGIYLAHSLVLVAAARAVYHFAPQILGIQVIFQAIMLGAGISIPLGLMWLVKHSPARPAYTYLFG